MANRIVLNPVSYHGAGAVKEIGGELQRRGFKRAFIASGRHVVKSGEIKKITDVLDEIGVAYTFFTDIKPNPSIENVQNGVKAFQEFTSGPTASSPWAAVPSWTPPRPSASS